MWHFLLITGIITGHVEIFWDCIVHSPDHVIISCNWWGFILSGFHTADNENGAWPAQPLEHIYPHNMMGTGGPSGHLHATQYLLSAHQPNVGISQLEENF